MDRSDFPDTRTMMERETGLTNFTERELLIGDKLISWADTELLDTVAASAKLLSEQREQIVEEIADTVEHLRDNFVSTAEPVAKVARLIREQFGSASVSANSGIAGPMSSAKEHTSSTCLPSSGEASYPALRDELLGIAKWIRTPGNINRDDAIDEIARVLENRVISLAIALPPPPQTGEK